ncbi:MAG TPA: hypothetical protein VHO69_17875 [Phototrophicaceae bacterium]|nr:hypothetical protein [Phototrophicaceae bacterium]
MRRLFVFVLVGLLLVLPVVAEESTPEPDVPQVAEGGLPPEQAVNLITLVTGLAIGVVTGGGGALLIVLGVIHRLRNDQAMLAAIEGLTKSYPAEAKETWLRIGTGLQETAEVIKEVFDGVPVGEKPAAVPTPLRE